MSFLPATGHIVLDPEQKKLDEWLREHENSISGLMILGGWELRWTQDCVDGIKLRYGPRPFLLARTLAQLIDHTTGSPCHWQDRKEGVSSNGDACARVVVASGKVAHSVCNGSCRRTREEWIELEEARVLLVESTDERFAEVFPSVAPGVWLDRIAESVGLQREGFFPLDSVITRDGELVADAESTPAT